MRHRLHLPAQRRIPAKQEETRHRRECARRPGGRRGLLRQGKRIRVLVQHAEPAQTQTTQRIKQKRINLCFLSRLDRFDAVCKD